MNSKILNAQNTSSSAVRNAKKKIRKRLEKDDCENKSINQNNQKESFDENSMRNQFKRKSLM
jgi:hypothetical protein